MCIAASTALLAGSTGLSMFSSIMGGNQSASDAKAAAAIARENAATVLNKGAVEEARILDNERRASGGITTYFASGNIDPAYGSPLLLQAESAAQANVDRQLVKAGALSDAAGYYQQSSTQLRKADQAQMAGWLGAASSLLKGATMWSKGSAGGGGSGGGGSWLEAFS